MLGIVRSYRREDFAPDVVAGLTVTVVTVPQALAYAFLAGLPPQAGLYACLAPMALYAVLGSSRQLVVGPVAIAALMVATALAEHAPAYSERYAQIAVVLSLQVGLFLCLLRLARLGGLASLLSHPVIAGFVNGAAILIIVSQLASLGGLSKTPVAGPARSLWRLAVRWRRLIRPRCSSAPRVWRRFGRCDGTPPNCCPVRGGITRSRAPARCWSPSRPAPRWFSSTWK